MEEIISAMETLQETGIEEAKRWYEEVSLEDAKAFIKANIITAARSFIAVGYYLKHIRDRQLYTEDGYATIWEFAAGEYGLSMSTASRYMTMNDRFSHNGNSPVVDAKYQEFGKSQLQEMLALNGEQEEQVTPQMKIQEIRELRKPKEIPYFPIEGQLSLEADFPEIMPDEEEAEGKQNFTMSLEDMLQGMESEEKAEPEVGFAISQQPEAELEQDEGEENKLWEEEKLPDESRSIGELPQAKEKHIRSLAQVLADKCGVRMVARPKDGYYASEATMREAMEYICRREDTVKLRDDVEAYGNPEFVEFYTGDEDLGVCSYAKLPTQVKKVMKNWEPPVSGEKPGPEEASEIEPESGQEQKSEEYTPQYFLEEQKEKLDRLLNASRGVKLQPMDVMVIERQKTIVYALASMVCDLEAIEFQERLEAEKPKQPELPPLKNNDHRAAFVDAYETWPIWIETGKTGERYYRYDLEDDTSMVIKVYHALLFDGFEEGSYKSRYHEGYGRQEYYLMQNGKFFRDCEVNRSALIDKLKEIQKQKGKREE